MRGIVTTRSGRVAGVDEGGYFAFRGIPYAAPPVGELWLQAPAREAAWDGIRPAGRPGPTAPQRRPRIQLAPEQYVEGSEYLNLNVFTPDPAAGGLPVLVWIHGGGFMTGTPTTSWYHPAGFVGDGIVVVSITYRLGLEGLLPIPGVPTNRAVRDWLAALGWVQECIGAFGGDPANVTIAGPSA